jgi:hypothetical protein
MTSERKAAVATGTADELDEIEKRIAALRCDVEVCHFHRAAVRLEWLRASIKSCATGLRQQAGKLKPKAP